MSVLSGVAQAGELREDLQGFNPRTYEGAEGIIVRLHQSLFRDDSKEIGTARVRCDGVLASIAELRSKLPFGVRVLAAEAGAECSFQNGKQAAAQQRLEGLLDLCRRPGCPSVLENGYKLARRWMWPEAMLPGIDRQLRALASGKPTKAEAEAHRSFTGVALRLNELKKRIDASWRSIEKRRSKGGFWVESLSVGGGAHEAGIRRGDVILSIGGKAIRNLAEFKSVNTAKGRELRSSRAKAQVHSVYFLREGLGHERNLGVREIKAKVVEIGKYTAPRQ